MLSFFLTPSLTNNGRIKSFTESNVWGLFNDTQSNFKKGELIECYSPIGPNINIFS